MKQNLNLYFTIGYLSGLENFILKKNQMEELKKTKTIEEFSSKLKSYKFKLCEFKSYEDFEEQIDNYFTQKMQEIKEIYPVKNHLNYIFCKNNFLNFKIYFKNKFNKNKIYNMPITPYTIAPDDIEKSLENENFQYIHSPFKESFQKILDYYKTSQNIKQSEILIDKKTYHTLLKIASDDSFLTKRTKIEISLKNIVFCIRFLKYNNNIKELDLNLIDEGVIKKENILNAANKNINNVFNLFKEFNIKANLNLDQNFSTIDAISEQILNNFDLNYIFNSFSLAQIFIYISKLKKENKRLKKILLKIYYQD